MFKKFFAVFFLAATLLIVGQSSDAEARSIPVGYYRDNGATAYLVTESIRGSRNNFHCTVAAGRDRVYYHFWYAGGGPYYSNSWGASAYVYGSGSPVAEGVWNWVQNNW